MHIGKQKPAGDAGFFVCALHIVSKMRNSAQGAARGFPRIEELSCGCKGRAFDCPSPRLLCRPRRRRLSRARSRGNVPQVARRRLCRFQLCRNVGGGRCGRVDFRAEHSADVRRGWWSCPISGERSTVRLSKNISSRRIPPPCSCWCARTAQRNSATTPKPCVATVWTGRGFRNMWLRFSSGRPSAKWSPPRRANCICAR